MVVGGGLYFIIGVWKFSWGPFFCWLCFVTLCYNFLRDWVKIVDMSGWWNRFIKAWIDKYIHLFPLGCQFGPLLFVLFWAFVIEIWLWAQYCFALITRSRLWLDLGLAQLLPRYIWIKGYTPHVPILWTTGRCDKRLFRYVRGLRQLPSYGNDPCSISGRFWSTLNFWSPIGIW